jgi:hypothetical protein
MRTAALSLSTPARRPEPTAWLGLLALLALLAPLCTAAALVLARNHWLAVALRYVVGVLLMRSSAGLRLRCLARCRPLQGAVAWVGLSLLAAVGLIVAVYLGTCYSVGRLVLRLGGGRGGRDWGTGAFGSTSVRQDACRSACVMSCS